MSLASENPDANGVEERAVAVERFRERLAVRT